jgi:hypothetical protein
MNFAQKIDFDAMMEPVARRLLGEPAQKHGSEWRYGSRGSLALDLKKGTWFDHEANTGGGVFDLIRRQGHEQPAAWLRREGLTAGQPHVFSRDEPHIVKTYDYSDEKGALLFQVVRYEPKDFRQRRPDGRGGWIWKLGDTRRVPYQLAHLMQAIVAGKTIYVPEGEKDVENLRAIGVAATTNPGGIKKWRDEYSEFLHGADIVVLPDNHVEGREHGEQVIASLRGFANRIRVLDIGKHWADCPDKGDISDWLGAGGTAEQLKAITDALPDVSISADNPSSRMTANQNLQDSHFTEPAWPTMGGDAYHGLAGDVVRAIEPHTESDPVAILIQFLVCAGNIIGNCPHYQVEGSRHRANLFSVLVGQSSKARKGTSLDRISEIIRIADEGWYSDRAKSGLSSGEGLINEVRDEFKKWNAKDGAWETIDPGISDKRLMITEPEFAGALVAVDRHGNTLSSVIRKAWDGGKLSTMTRSSPLCATGAHISIIGHITVEELRARLTRTDTANGFANRFLFMLVKRSRVLPFGGDALEDGLILELGERLKRAISAASPIGRVGWTSPARDAWKAVYAQLSEGQPGLLGAVTSRAEAQSVRLALIYALLDGAANIDVPHIRAALAVWEYAEVSAAHIFGGSLGDNVADEILRALQHAGREGMSRTAIRDLFGRNQSGGRLGAALTLLASRGKAGTEIRQSGGRPIETWIATEIHRHG